MGRRLGQDKSLIDRRPPFMLYRRLFGSEDMHSHYRWEAVSPLIDRGASATLEVGGGDGRIGFEVARTGHAGRLVLSELDPRTLDEAKRTAELGGFSNVEVVPDDLRALSVSERFDQVLCIDVLEHIDDDQDALRQVSDVMQPGGRLVISVPTPLYPKVFGRRFHEQIGHVRDGYWLEDLAQKLDAAGLTIKEHHYYTGPALQEACRWFYGRHIPYPIGVTWAPLVRPWLQRKDRDVADREGASLALVAVRSTI